MEFTNGVTIEFTSHGAIMSGVLLGEKSCKKKVIIKYFCPIKQKYRLITKRKTAIEKDQEIIRKAKRG